VATATLTRQVAKLREQLALRTPKTTPLLAAVRRDPAQILTRAGVTPDSWQKDLLRSSSDRFLLLCSRQAGKSTVAAALALRTALLNPGLILLLSPTQRQSGELFKDKFLRLYRDLGKPVAVVQQSALTMELANGARVVSLPGDEGTIRGYSSVKCLIVDEAARVEDALYTTVRPMLAVSRGRLVALSTPWGKRGWFFEEWTGRGGGWERIKVTADRCPRITPEFLAEERRALGERWYRQEYGCEFCEAVDAVFLQDDIEAMVCPDIAPLRL
jgi:hypothetical protein